ncbi:unnamed protein product [Rotaria sordida]|uniref:Uncharacterized protein n=1 Tax=Rotaria sordida TaxID=392033 RepID=A0A815QUE4_9BILA|nr:unnamed protein product [Rotaria sordida]
MRTTTSNVISLNLSCLTWDKNGLTIAGAQNGENGQALNRLYGPRDIIVDNESIYVSDTLNRRLLKFVAPSTEGQLLVTDDIIHGLSLNREEQIIYFSQESGNNDLIRRISTSGGDSSIVVPGGYVSRPYSIVAFERSTYICDTNNHRVILWSNIDKNFTIVAGGNGMGSDFNQLQAPQGIFVDINRNVYVADTFNHRIQLWKTDASGGITVAGDSNLGSGLYQLSSPKAIFVDNSAMFIVDSGNNRMLKWNIGESRAEVVLAGGVSNSNTNQLYNPTSVKFDSQGNMYIVDNGNNRVQKYLVNNTQC